MDTQMWGPIVWDVLAAIARACDDLEPDWINLVPGWPNLAPYSLDRLQATLDAIAARQQMEGVRARAMRAFVLLAYALKYVLPCIFCRNSYVHFIEVIAPAEFVCGSNEAALLRVVAASRVASSSPPVGHGVHDRDHACRENVLATPVAYRTTDVCAVTDSARDSVLDRCVQNALSFGSASCGTVVTPTCSFRPNGRYDTRGGNIGEDENDEEGDDRQWAAPEITASRSVMPVGAVGTLDAFAQTRGTLLDWVWITHDRVNRKLGVNNVFTRRRFRKRMRITSSLLHPSAVWDLITIIALNYPQDPGQGDTKPDPQRQDKCCAHAVLLSALTVLLPLVPDLGSLAPYVDPQRAIGAGALVSRTPFLNWVRSEKRRWMHETGVDRGVCARMLAAESAYIASVA